MVGFLVSGGLLGGIVGALLASLFAKIFQTQNLLLACPFLLTMCLVLVIFLRELKKDEKKAKEKGAINKKRKKVGYFQSFQSFAKNRHLILLSGIMASAILVTTLIDFQFNSVIERVFDERDARTAFLGTFFTLLLVFSIYGI